MNDLVTMAMTDLAPVDQPTFQIPIKGGELFPLPNNELAMYKMAYPKIDVEGEIGRMIAWCVSNPAQRKTKRGVLRFVNGWLNRARPSQAQPAGITQKEYAASTSIADRVNDLSWADGL